LRRRGGASDVSKRLPCGIDVPSKGCFHKLCPEPLPILREALAIETSQFALFDAIDELLDLARISVGDVISMKPTGS
jgi:hypothetical protein